MDRYSPNYAEDEPLDLSFKPRVFDKETGKPVQQESPLCLVKSCNCNVRNGISADAMVIESRVYSRFGTKLKSRDELCNQHREDCALLNPQGNGCHQDRITSVSPITTSITKTSPPPPSPTFTSRAHALPPPSNHSAAPHHHPTSDKSNGRFDIGYLSQPARGPIPLQPKTFLDVVNKSIENGLRNEFGTNSLKRGSPDSEKQFNNESQRSSPTQSKRLKGSSETLYSANQSSDIFKEEESKTNLGVIKLDISKNLNTQRNGESNVLTNIKEERSSTVPTQQVESSTENGSDGARKKPSKIPALDYLISKVLVERLDIPYIPKTHQIKRIFTGEGKGQLRLVDLIELQVEESLKV